MPNRRYGIVCGRLWSARRPGRPDRIRTFGHVRLVRATRDETRPEIGCGTGTSTLAMAQAELDVDVIAVEVSPTRARDALSGIDREGVPNVRLIRRRRRRRARNTCWPQPRLYWRTGVFPDPWPKSRHHKRRLLQADTVALIASRLRPGGILHAATDHPDTQSRSPR